MRGGDIGRTRSRVQRGPGASGERNVAGGDRTGRLARRAAGPRTRATCSRLRRETGPRHTERRGACRAEVEDPGPLRRASPRAR